MKDLKKKKRNDDIKFSTFFVELHLDDVLEVLIG